VGFGWQISLSTFSTRTVSSSLRILVLFYGLGFKLDSMGSSSLLLLLLLPLLLLLYYMPTGLVRFDDHVRENLIPFPKFPITFSRLAGSAIVKLSCIGPRK
jgi:hypothetical protein